MHDQHHATEELDEAKASRPVLKGGGGPQRPSPTQQFGPAFARVAAASGIEEVRIAHQTPRMNAIAERFLGSVRRECLDHVIILGDRHLERILGDYSRYFNRERPHQGLGQGLPEPAVAPTDYDGPSLRVRSAPVLGGLHHTYHRAA